MANLIKGWIVVSLVVVFTSGIARADKASRDAKRAAKAAKKNGTAPAPAAVAPVAAGLPSEPVVIDEGWADDAGDTRVDLAGLNDAGALVAWVPAWHIFVKYKDASADDILVLQHYKGSKKLGKPSKCRMHRPPSDYNQQAAYFKCPKKLERSVGSNTEVVITKPGSYKTVLTYKGADGKKFENFRTLKFNVIQFTATQAKKSPKGLAIDRDWRVNHGSVSISHNNAHADVKVWVKHDRNNKPKPSMRCYFDGKLVVGKSSVRAQRAPQYRFYKGKKDTNVVWTQFRFSQFGLVIGDEARAQKDAHFTSKNPGDYKCTVLNDGDIIKEVFFTIKDGKVQAPKKCAAVPNDDFTFVKVVSKKGGDYKYDEKAYAKDAFWGQGGCEF